ncbi:MAG TPA: addiction module protein [Kofleriaceae bacterium]|nr:addiction module protein [Kofleriaceae bacterium]
MSSRERVFADALALPEQDRLRLARELLASFDPGELRPEDEAELMDRIEEIDRGGDTVDGAVLLASLRSRRSA